MRIAIIGLGSAARRIHIPAYRRVEQLQVVGGCDQNPGLAKVEFPVFDSVDRMIRECHPDIVTIATPTATHFTIASQLLAKGIHVFCEKPFTSTVDQAVELLRIASANRVEIVVNNEFRFMTCHRNAKALIGSERFGDLLFVHMHQAFRASDETESGWRGEDVERTCKDFGTHVFDLCRYFFGEEPVRLRAYMPKPGDPTGPDLLNLIDLEFRGDRYARITLDRLTTGRHRYLDIRLDGTQGCIETELGGHLALTAGVHPASRRPFVDFDLSLGGRAFLYQGEGKVKIGADPLDLFANATAGLMNEFVAALQRGTRPPCHGADNLRTLALMRAAYESAASGGDIDLSYLAALG